MVTVKTGTYWTECVYINLWFAAALKEMESTSSDISELIQQRRGINCDTEHLYRRLYEQSRVFEGIDKGFGC